MIIVNEASGEFYGDDGFRGLFPNKSFPSVLTKEIVEDHGFAVAEESQPQAGQMLYQIQRVDGAWKQVWYADNTPVVGKVNIIKDRINTQIKMHLDMSARDGGYDDIVTAVSYKDSTNPQFSADAMRFIQLRDSYWAAVIEVLTNIADDDHHNVEQSVAKKMREIHDKVNAA